MGTLVSLTSPDAPAPGALAAMARTLADIEAVFSTWDPKSPMSKLRAGRTDISELPRAQAAQVTHVLDRCRLARELTSGAFDPWAMPGGLDPTGLVKGWAAMQALAAVRAVGQTTVMVNAGGDIATSPLPDGGPWRVGVRHPWQPTALLGVIGVTGAIATSGTYERPGQLFEPGTGRVVGGPVSATVTGPDLDLADALATGLAVGGGSVLRAIEAMDGYEALLVATDGLCYGTPGLALLDRPDVT